MKQIVTYYYLIAIILFTACGDQHSSPNESVASEEEPKPLVFKGFVQRAFPITVEGISFNDSEHFYTRFIDDLIFSNPEYENALDGASIEIEGEYGVTRFGSNAEVFLSSELNEGHIFQSKTGANAEFNVQVIPESLDESFKARVILRIGLIIDYADSNSQHFCYILHSIIDGISIDEHTKPIIFSDFNTQLNEYRCSDRRGIEIDIDRFVEPGEDNGKSDISPKVELEDQVLFEHGIHSEDNEGELSLIQVSNTDDQMLLTFGKLRSKADGKVFYPTLRIANAFSSGAKGRIEVDEGLLSYNRRCYFMIHLDGVLVKPCNQISERFFELHKGDDVIDIGPSRNGDGEHLMFVHNEHLWQLNPNREICNVDLETEQIYQQCEVLPDSNPSKTYRNCAASDQEIHCLVINEQESAVYKYNLNGIFQERYYLSRLSFPQKATAHLRVISDGRHFHFVNLNANKIVFTSYSLIN
jgi:hypothetical protein